MTRWLGTNITKIRKLIFFFLDRNTFKALLLLTQHKSMSVWCCSKFTPGIFWISSWIAWVGTFITCQPCSPVLSKSTFVGTYAERCCVPVVIPCLTTEGQWFNDDSRPEEYAAFPGGLSSAVMKTDEILVPNLPYLSSIWKQLLICHWTDPWLSAILWLAPRMFVC